MADQPIVFEFDPDKDVFENNGKIAVSIAVIQGKSRVGFVRCYFEPSVSRQDAVKRVKLLASGPRGVALAQEVVGGGGTYESYELCTDLSREILGGMER